MELEIERVVSQNAGDITIKMSDDSKGDIVGSVVKEYESVAG